MIHPCGFNIASQLGCIAQRHVLVTTRFQILHWLTQNTYTINNYYNFNNSIPRFIEDVDDTSIKNNATWLSWCNDGNSIWASNIDCIGKDLDQLRKLIVTPYGFGINLCFELLNFSESVTNLWIVTLIGVKCEIINYWLHFRAWTMLRSNVFMLVFTSRFELLNLKCLN